MLDPQTIPGFLTAEEGQALADAVALGCADGASRSPVPPPVVEIGAYCGRSTVYLGRAARAAGTVVYAVDHHRGSEEHQPGGGYDDPRFWDAEAGRVDTLPAFRDTIRRADLEDVVLAVVGSSAVVAARWTTPVGVLFVDGGHSLATALEDWRGWAGHVAMGGVLAIHDVFHRPEEGGRPPHEVFLRAAASGLFDPLARVGTLQVLRRVGPRPLHAPAPVQG